MKNAFAILIAIGLCSCDRAPKVLTISEDAMNEESNVEIDDICFGHPSWSSIVDKAVADGLLNLDQDEKVRYLLGELYGQVGNGGVEQWYVNAGTLAADTIETLKEVGATRTAAKIESINKLFPGSTPSHDDDERGDQLEAIAQRSEKFQELSQDLEHWLMGEPLPNGEHAFADEDPVRLAHDYLRKNSQP